MSTVRLEQLRTEPEKPLNIFNSLMGEQSDAAIYKNIRALMRLLYGACPE